MKNAAEKVDRGASVAEMWDGFAGLVIPFAPPGTTQHEEMKKAFYSGALCLFNWFMVQLDEGDDASDDDLNRVSLIEAELRGFMTGERPQA